MNKSIFASIIICLISASTFSADQPITEPVKASAALPTGSGLWIGVGPDMKILPIGTYRFIFLPSDVTKQVEVTTISMTGDAPIPPVPPAPDDTRSALITALAGVTDTTKTQTAASMLQVFTELVKGANEGKVTQVQIVSGVSTLSMLLTSGKTGWLVFTNVLNTQLVKQTSLTGVTSVLGIAIEELGKIK